MTRHARPTPPREAKPDLPRELTDEAVPGRHDDRLGVRFVALSGDVDAAHSRLAECVADAAALDRFDLTGATLSDVRLSGIRAAEVIARDASWRTVVIGPGRIGTLDLMRAELDAVVLTDLRIDYLSLAAARIADLRIVRCDIGSIDLPDARVERVAFEDSRADEVDTRGLRARDLDLRGLEMLAVTDPAGLRGATLTARQAEGHAEAFAVTLGIAIAGE